MLQNATKEPKPPYDVTKPKQTAMDRVHEFYNDVFLPLKEEFWTTQGHFSDLTPLDFGDECSDDESLADEDYFPTAQLTTLRDKLTLSQAENIKAAAIRLIEAYNKFNEGTRSKVSSDDVEASDTAKNVVKSKSDEEECLQRGGLVLEDLKGVGDRFGARRGWDQRGWA